tara:strand:+ start:67 stop:327 length:261 start_codon:yes stop_codon:yes gene_type:complete
MSNRYKKGDLVFVPSDLTLLQFADKLVENLLTPSVKNFTRTKIPSPVIIVENETESPYCSILYNGERWHVPKIDIYPLPGNNMNDS